MDGSNTHVFSLRNYRKAINSARTFGRPSVPVAAFDVARARFTCGLGPFYHSLFDLSRKPSSRWREYVTSRDTNVVTRRVNGPANYALARDKIVFARHCVENGIQTIPVVVIISIDPEANLAGVPTVATKADLQYVLRSAPDRLFFKPIDGAHGEGAFSATRRGELWTFAGRSGTTADLYRFCADRQGEHRGWLVQPVVVAHEALRQIMAPGALGTLRIISYLENDQAKLLLPVIKLPVGTGITDNFSNGMSGNLVAPVDLENGNLGTARGSTDFEWPCMATVDTHPDTGNRISGTKVPYWSETVAVVLEAQRRTPRLRTLGWDVAISQDGPLIVEANTLYSAELLQVAYDRGIRADLAPIYAL